MSQGKIILSPSEIIMYNQCPARYYYYKHGVPSITLEPLEFGKDIHNIIKRYYQIIPQGISPKEVKLYLTKASRDVIGEGPIIDKMLYHLQGFLKFEEDRIGSWHINSRPIAIEKRYTKQFLDGVSLKGVIDAIFRKMDRVVVVDWKTGYGYNPQIDYKLAIQGMVYKYLVNADEVYFIFLRFGIYRKMPDYDFEWLKGIVEDVVKNISSHKFDWNIEEHCESCPYNLYCNFHRRGWTIWNL